MKTATITFTEEEARVTLNLFDAAVKSLGLNAAEAAAVLAKKINSAFLEGPTGNVGPCAAEGVPLNVL